ncbi:MAG TPA: DUF6042 family protein [Solirubrobacterales bacterium]|nr:DUF6042 family protein [Solirubrobacterales bacterium]
MSEPGLNLASSGWLRNLPAPALRAYMGILLLAREGAPPLGDLEEDGAAFWVAQVAPRGLDEPYEPSDEAGWTEDLENEMALWEEWQGYAANLARPLTNCRDLIEFMIDLGLIEEGTGEEAWRTVSPLPLVEDVLPISDERREVESQIRWRLNFMPAERAITAWIAKNNPGGVAESEIRTSLKAIAADLGLDIEDARHGLAVLLDEDVRCDVDPETAADPEPLRLHIDWQLFEDLRTLYRAAPPQ